MGMLAVCSDFIGDFRKLPFPSHLGKYVIKIGEMCAKIIAPDKAAYCVFTQFRESENAIKFISMRTKTQ